MLITLGIIGVVAAITMPTLIKSYQKQVLVNQLKKVVNTLTNNSRKILADEGVDILQDTSLYTVDGSIQDGNHDFKLNKDNFEKYYKLTPLSENTEYAKLVNKSMKGDIIEEENGEELYNYYSNDGACITVTSFANEFSGLEVFVDINCDKRPNKFGYDRFYLILENNGILNTKQISTDICSSENLNAEIDESEISLYWAFLGAGCFNRIVQDGWKMNY